MTDKWTWKNRQGGDLTHTGDLELYWEVNGDPISDDFTPDDMSAVDLLEMWAKNYYPNPKVEAIYGPGMVNIYWSVEGETAPFGNDPEVFVEHFLTFYTWPTHVETGERVNFNRLPVRDKQWGPGGMDKGGFIQEATGWKPSPFQPVMHVPTVFAAARLAVSETTVAGI
jgi:hypothetical protein